MTTIIQSLPGFDVEPEANTEAKLRSDEARKIFETTGEYGEWLDDYFRLIAEGWPWRVAVYIIWASLPTDRRQPRTQQALATEVLGLASDRRIRQWRAQNPAIDTRIRALQVSALAKNRAQIIGALIESASNPDPRASSDRKMALEMLGDYIPRQATISTVVNVDEADTADLLAQAQIPTEAREE